MNDPTSAIYTRNARRQIRYALSTGKENDLYGAIYQLIGHRCHLATIKDHQRVAFYCDPQGIVNFDMEISRSQREGLNDPDYAPSASSVGGNPVRNIDEVEAVAEGDAAQVGEGATEEDDTEDEDEEDEDEDDEEEDDDEEEGEGEDDEEDDEEEARAGVSKAEAERGMRLRSRNAPAPVKPTSSSAGATSSAASTVFNHSIARYPDYRLVKAYLDDHDNERVRYNLAIVEVKIFAPQLPNSPWFQGRHDVRSVANYMLPQVIQAVQVIFAKHESYKEVVAIPVVNEFCKFMYFRRTDVPPLDITNFNSRGYHEPGSLESKALAKKLRKYAYKTSSGDMIKMIYGVEKSARRLGWGAAFLKRWKEFLDWTEKDELFPEQPEV